MLNIFLIILYNTYIYKIYIYIYITCFIIWQYLNIYKKKCIIIYTLDCSICLLFIYNYIRWKLYNILSM